MDAIQLQKVTKIAFLNGLDESYNEEAYDLMIYYGRLLHESMGRGWFSTASTAIRTEVMAKLAAEWSCSCATRGIRSRQGNGIPEERHRYLFYGPMITTEEELRLWINHLLDLEPAREPRHGWLGWKYQTGWVEWSSTERLRRPVRGGEFQRAERI